MNYPFPLPPTSDAELRIVASRVYSNWSEMSIDDIDEQASMFINNIDSSNWLNYNNIPHPDNCNYPNTYIWLAAKLKREAIETMPEQIKLINFLRFHKPDWEPIYLLDANSKAWGLELEYEQRSIYKNVYDFIEKFQHLPHLCSYLIVTKHHNWLNYSIQEQKKILINELPTFDYEQAELRHNNYAITKEKWYEPPF
jgi:hypothetical protein